MLSSCSRTKCTLAILIGISSATLLISSGSQRLGSLTSPIFKGEAVNFSGGELKAPVNSEQRPAIDDADAKTRVLDAYGKLPLSFEANEGQFDYRVKFVSRAGSQTLFLTATEAVLKMTVPGGAARNEKPFLLTIPDSQGAATGESQEAALRMKLVGANPAAKVTGLDELPGKSNYFIGSDPKKWRVNVPNYAKVKYARVYPGVDLVYYGNQHQLEYDFLVDPGADPGLIRFVYEGALTTSLHESGDLVFSTPAGETRHRKPVAYQENDGFKKEVAARYVLMPDSRIGFEVAEYDLTRPLVIDPVLSYSTYLGGSASDNGSAIAVDLAGNAYVTGFTQSMNFPITPGAFQTVPAEFSTVFVTKINQSGTALVYSSYLGVGEGHGIAVDSLGSAYVLGRTGDANFPVTLGAFDTTYNGGSDAFITKLNSSGSALVYSSYLGGASVEFAEAIALDSAGQAYVTGLTTSPDFPITPGAFQSEFRGGFAPGGCSWGDAFVSKLNSTGSGLAYSTYLGGTLPDGADAIAVDSGGNAYVTGATSSTNFPTSAGAFQSAHTACPQFICASCLCEDAFITKLNAQGTGIVYSSFLGGQVCETGMGIAVDGSGNAYVTGRTNSPDFPRKNPIQSFFGGFRDVFVTKINATGASLIFSTYLGGTDDDQGLGIAADSAGNSYVAGVTNRDFVSRGSAFVMKLDPIGASAYFLKIGESSQGVSSGEGIAVDAAGRAYVTGSAGAPGFPTTPGAFQPTFGGVIDAFVAKIDDMPPFDVCLQDESNGAILQFNSIAGNYQFTNCRGLIVGGIGVISTRGCVTTLQVNGPDRRLLARIDACMKSGTASMQVFAQGATFTILDRNTANNSCVCAGN